MRLTPGTEAELLAIVLSPAGAFAAPGERAEVGPALLRMKREIVRRFWAARRKS
jgi:hypothetical protein